MHSIDFPAGWAVRLTATARPDAGVHRWDVNVRAVADPPYPPLRLAYTSQIGGRDCEQHIDIPAQDTACRLEIASRHPVAGGWRDDDEWVEDDTPDGLLIGFSDAPKPGSSRDDLLLRFTFTAPY